MILVINTGSSSLKYKLFSTDFEVLKSGGVADIGGKVRDHLKAANMILPEISPDISKITKVGYRVVHGGDEADEIMPITLPTMKIIEKFSPLAPHHNPQTTIVIKFFIEKLPYAQHFAAFDCAYFKNLPIIAKTYPIDADIADEFAIRRFGFHGISHQYMQAEVDPENEKKVITIHLGAGSSMAAIENGKPIDTTMGWTPMDGIPSQTRSGEIDPEIVLFLSEKIGIRKVRDIFENHSGLAGISGTSGAMLTLLSLAEEKVEDDNFHLSLDKTAKFGTKESAKLAIELYCYRIKKCIGAYAAALGGVDIVVFSGEIGFGSSVIRDMATDGLEFLNFEIKTIKPSEELAIAKKLK